MLLIEINDSFVLLCLLDSYVFFYLILFIFWGSFLGYKYINMGWKLIVVLSKGKVN